MRVVCLGASAQHDTTVEDDGTIIFSNDGNGIDIAKHPENDLWIPEMVFGHLRTSTNYNKTRIGDGTATESAQKNSFGVCVDV